MKFFKKAIIFLALLIIAGFAYWYFEVKKGKEKEKAEEKASMLFEQSDKAIVKLVLKEKGQSPIVMEKKLKELEKEEEEEEWIISSPVGTGGDTYVIDAIISSIKEGKREEVVWENLEKEGEYGLDDPSLSLKFYYENEATEQGIDFGIESLDNKKVFAKVTGKNMIFLVPVAVREAFKKSLFDVRDKSIAHFNSDDIIGVTLLSSNYAFVLEKEGDDWYFMPEKLKASKTRVDMYTGSLRWGSFVEVEEERGTDLVKYGLDRPRLMLNFNLKDNSNFMFVVGDSVEEDEPQFFYATRSTDGMIFQVKSDLVYSLAKTKFELKDRKIFEFTDEDVNSVTLKEDGNIFSLVKEDDEWKLRDTGEKIGRGYKIDNIVRNILTAEYEVREPIKRGDNDYQLTGIANPKYTVTLNFTDNRPPLTVQLTEMDEETGKLWLTHDNGDTVYYISGYFVSNFPEDREELLE